MDKSRFHLNPDAEIVKNIREGLKRTGGYLIFYTHAANVPSVKIIFPSASASAV